MKINNSLPKNNYEYLSPYVMKNSSEINTNSNSPIKVRKKENLIKVNSLECFKLMKASNHNSKKASKCQIKKINYNNFIRKNLLKYNSYPFYLYIKISNQLLFNVPNHLVSLFKDYLIWNENYEYFKNKYSLNQSKELLPKLGNYYQIYTLFIPIYFPLNDLNSILTKYIKNKMKYLEMTENDDTLKEEVISMDKNICDTKNEIKEKNNDKNEILIENESNNNNNDKKLINTTDIKTENSCSVSNFFGIERSIIKNKDNSNYGIINNFENQVINYPLLYEIKNVHNHSKKDNKDNKVNLDYSLELASIIQSFEENEKKFLKNYRIPKTKSHDTKKPKDFNNNKFGVEIKKSKTNININNKKHKRIPRTNKKKLNICVACKYQIKSHRSKVQTTKNKNKILYQNKNNNLYIIKENQIKNKTIETNPNHRLTLNSENNNNIIKKINNQHINTEQTLNNNYNTYISNKNDKNKNYAFLYKNQSNPLSTKVIKINNHETKKIIYKKKIAKSKESKESKESTNNIINKNNRNITKRRINKRNNLTLNFLNKNNSNKENEYIKINTSSSINIKSTINNSRNRNRNNMGRSQSQRYNLNKYYTNNNLNKMIFVNKKTDYYNSTTGKQYTNNRNSSYSSNKDFNTLNSNQTTNKIYVNKKGDLIKSLKKENTTNSSKNKNNLNILEINYLGKKKTLTKYKSFVEYDYNNLVPKLILKKMFFNKIKNEKITNNKHNKNKNKYSSLKKHNISSKNNQNTSSINTNTKIKPNFHKYLDMKIPKTDKTNETNENKKFSKYNSIKKIVPKSEIHSPSKSSLRFGNLSKKRSVYATNNKIKNKKNVIKDKNYTDKKINTLKEINKMKSSNTLKKRYVSKTNYMLDINNNYKINTESKISYTKKKREILNDSLKSAYINKNKIHHLIKNSELKKGQDNEKTLYPIFNQKSNTIKNTIYSIESTGLSKREKKKIVK